jgi:hypothetical protein
MIPFLDKLTEDEMKLLAELRRQKAIILAEIQVTFKRKVKLVSD